MTTSNAECWEIDSVVLCNAHLNSYPPSWWLNHPSEKYWSNWIISSQIGVKIENIWNHHQLPLYTPKSLQTKSEEPKTWSPTTTLCHGFHGISPFATDDVPATALQPATLISGAPLHDVTLMQICQRQHHLTGGVNISSCWGERTKQVKQVSTEVGIFGGEKRHVNVSIWVTDKIWYMAKGHPKVGWAPVGFAVAAPCTNLPQGIVLGIVLGWAPIGFAAMATPRPSHILLWSYLILSDTHIGNLMKRWVCSS